MTPLRRLPTASLFAQLLALVAVSLVAASVINLLVIFNLPPPGPGLLPHQRGSPRW